jgi:transcriptional regulator with XRE-family HTH domain
MKSGKHWTSEDSEAFVHGLAFDFIVQVEKRMEELDLNQAAVAQRLGVSEGAVSHVLNNPQNLTLKTIARYCQALNIRVSVVMYDIGDRAEEVGPIPGEIFESCWSRSGKPQQFDDLQLTRAGTEASCLLPALVMNKVFASTAERPAFPLTALENMSLKVHTAGRY